MAIHLKNLEFGYQLPRPVLSIQDFSLKMGEKVFLHGPSGCGKTTLLGIITGILAPTRGEVKILGENFSQLSASTRDRLRADRMGYIFQQLNLLPYLSGLENILVTTWVSDKRRSRIDGSTQDEARRLAKRLAIEDVLMKMPTEMSVGQQQRVAAARALIGKPDLLIADEPTSALDDDRQQEFIDLLLNQSNEFGTSVLFVSHNRQLQSHFDRVISLLDLNQAGGDYARSTRT